MAYSSHREENFDGGLSALRGRLTWSVTPTSYCIKNASEVFQSAENELK